MGKEKVEENGEAATNDEASPINKKDEDDIILKLLNFRKNKILVSRRKLKTT